MTLRRDPSSVTLYLGKQEVRLDRATNTARATRYYAHGGQVVAVRTGVGLSWLASDHQATAQLSIDVNSLRVSRRRQLPFGSPRGQAPVVWPGERGFVGGTLDASTGLTHLGAREYDPTVGRFISVDPIMDLTDPQQMHGYTYSNNSPVTFSDPSGLKQCADEGCRQYSDSKGKIHGSAPSPIVTDHGNNFIGTEDISTGDEWLNDVKLPKNAPRLTKLGPRISQHYGGPVPGDPGTMFNLENTLSALMSFCNYADPEFCGVEFREWVILAMNDFWIGSGMYAEAASGRGGGGVRRSGSGFAAPSAPVSRRAPQACVPDNSFVPGTLVLMADGTHKPIEQITVGDQVLATDPDTSHTGPQQVVATIIGHGQKDLVEITVDTDGRAGDTTRAIIATAAHPFWLPDRSEWKEAGELKAGQLLQTAAGTWIQVTAIRTWTAEGRVYNLTTDDFHTYYVNAGNHDVLVHNSAPCGTAAAGWADKADFSDKSSLQAKYKHAGDFGVTGNQNNANLELFEKAMKDHMIAPGTKIYRFNYRNQAQAIGFIDPSSNNMVMLNSEGKFWTAYKLGNNQFASVVDKGFLW